MATKTTLVHVLLGSSGTGSGTLQNRYCGGFLNPSNGLTVNAPVRDCTQPVCFPGFMMNSVSQQHFAKNPSMYGNSINPVWGFVCDGCNNWWKRCDWHKWQRRSVSNLDPRALCHKQGRIKHTHNTRVMMTLSSLHLGNLNSYHKSLKYNSKWSYLQLRDPWEKKSICPWSIRTWPIFVTDFVIIGKNCVTRSLVMLIGVAILCFINLVYYKNFACNLRTHITLSLFVSHEFFLTVG